MPHALRRYAHAFALLAITFVCLPAFAKHHGGKAKKPARPNIIIIMSDDMGFSDIGCYGGEIKTPVLDSLANKGVRFTQFYNTGRCCPTRAALLTGVYQHQAGIGHMMGPRGNLPGYRGDLGKNVLTIAEAVKTAGYSTYMAGKWHVTPKVKATDKLEQHNWPRQRGFDRFFGTIHGAGSFFDPNSLTRDNTLIVPPTDDFYYTDAINDHAAKFIREHKGEQPFFVYVAHTAAHWPMHAKPADIAKYKGKYDQGWDKVRETRYAKMKRIGLLLDNAKLSPRDKRSPAWEDAPNKAWDLRNMEVYAAMVDCMDQGVGRIVKTLKETGHYDNTLILFLQDNGGCAEGMGRQNKLVYRDNDPDTLKPMGKNELQFDMIPRRTRDGKPLRQGVGVMAGPADTYIGYGLGWANASNTPFREYKHWVHEGGIATPLIAHWPKGIGKDRHGKFDRQPSHLIDLMATAVDLAGVKYPGKFKGNDILPLEGVSLAPAFRGQSLERKNPIFWEHEGNRAMRDGKWKLVAKGAHSPWELYDLSVDRSELNNLADKHPEKLREMADTWEAWAKRALVKPWPWDRGRKGNNKKPNNKPNNKKAFNLKQGDELEQADAPQTTDRDIAITAKLETLGEGVIVAQGGVVHGYSLFIEKGKLCFAARVNGKLALVQTSIKSAGLKAGGTVGATLNKKDNATLVTLTIDGKPAGTGFAHSQIKTPADALSVGLDSNDPVANYPRGFKYAGKIAGVSVVLN